MVSSKIFVGTASNRGNPDPMEGGLPQIGGIFGVLSRGRDGPAGVKLLGIASSPLVAGPGHSPLGPVTGAVLFTGANVDDSFCLFAYVSSVGGAGRFLDPWVEVFPTVGDACLLGLS